MAVFARRLGKSSSPLSLRPAGALVLEDLLAQLGAVGLPDLLPPRLLSCRDDLQHLPISLECARRNLRRGLVTIAV